MLVERTIEASIKKRLFKNKAILISGPRQSGKTTLLKKLEKNLQGRVLFLNCDEPDIRKLLTGASSTTLKNITGPADIIMIDEAQRVRNIGLTLKLLTDSLPGVQTLVTGSAALELADEINEPLTGRKWEYLLLPFSIQELVRYHGILEEKRLLHQRLIYGMYPDVINNPGDEREILTSLSGSYLYKDIFILQEIRRPEIIERLLEALALQVASEVSYNELSRILGIDTATVQRYIDLLEKSYVVFRLRSFSRNLRNELKKSRKIYFYDNGIRNALISNLQPFELRTDKGALWENFLVSERVKFLQNNRIHAGQYFWRTKQQQEIDYIEEREGVLNAFEFKTSSRNKSKFPRTFLKAYPGGTARIINAENYLEFLLP